MISTMLRDAASISIVMPVVGSIQANSARRCSSGVVERRIVCSTDCASPQAARA